MPAIGIRVSAWQNATAFQRRVLRIIGRMVRMGDPARYTDGTNQWHIADDDRITLRHLAAFGACVVKLSTMSQSQQDSFDALDDDALRDAVEDWLTTGGHVVWPAQIVYNDDPTAPNVYQQTLDAQGTPAAVRAAGGVPDGLTAVEA